MKRAQQRDILGELFLSHEGSDGGVDCAHVCSAVSASLSARVCLCV